MKALAASLVCLLAFNAPSQAFFHGGGGGGGSHPAPHPGHGGDHHHGGRFYDPFAPQVLDSYTDPNPPAAEPADDQPPIIELPPAPLCPAAAPVPAGPVGPHIIYIGQKPVIHGPKVIYGVQ